LCGIVGIVQSAETPIDAELLAAMCEAIRHRGPDNHGFYFKGVGLRMRGFQSSTSKVDGSPSPIRIDPRGLRGITTKYLLKKALKNLLPAENFELAQDGFWGPYRPLVSRPFAGLFAGNAIV